MSGREAPGKGQASWDVKNIKVFLELRVGESSEPKGRLRLPAADPALRESLQGLPTTFALPGEAVDRLRAAAAQVLRESPAFERFVGSLATPR